jgi:hypothetical protein
LVERKARIKGESNEGMKGKRKERKDQRKEQKVRGRKEGVDKQKVICTLPLSVLPFPPLPSHLPPTLLPSVHSFLPSLLASFCRGAGG